VAARPAIVETRYERIMALSTCNGTTLARHGE
jgi:hypothetical protein